MVINNVFKRTFFIKHEIRCLKRYAMLNISKFDIVNFTNKNKMGNRTIVLIIPSLERFLYTYSKSRSNDYVLQLPTK